jgi:hypothetical protein
VYLSFSGSAILHRKVANDHWVKGRWSAWDIGSGINQPEKPANPRPLENAVEDGEGFVMPKLAASWEELVQVLSGSGAKADGCVSVS